MRAARRRSLDDDLHLLARLQVLAGAKPVEHAEALELTIGDCHALREPLRRVAGSNRNELQTQWLCGLAFGEREPAEARHRLAECAIDFRGAALGGKDEAVHIGAEPQRVEPER